MKKILFIAIFLVAPAPLALASGVGFSQGLWTSDATPVLGEEISIFALVSNSSSRSISGAVVFYDGTTELGTAHFAAGKDGGYDVVHVPFTLSTGVHHVHAELQGVSGGSADTSTSGELAIEATDEGRSPTSIDSIVSATTGSFSNLLQQGSAYVKSNAPWLTSAASSTYDRVETFRATEAQSLHKKADVLYQEAAAESKGAHIGPTASTSKSTSYATVGKQFEYLALAALSYVFFHRIWFYLIALILLWWLLRAVFRVLRRLIRGRPE